MNTHVREQESCVSPNLTAFLEMTPAMRRLLEVAVQNAMDFAESMTLFLDEVDGDETLEEGEAAEDGDPLETNGDELEPSLGSIAARDWDNQRHWAHGSADDAEDEHDGTEESGDENEPWLGATEPLPRDANAMKWFGGRLVRVCEGDGDPLDQTRWAGSGAGSLAMSAMGEPLEADDADDEDGDPAEANGDELEPSLGSVSHWYQPNWTCGYTGDLEADAGDEGEREDHW